MMSNGGKGNETGVSVVCGYKSVDGLDRIDGSHCVRSLRGCGVVNQGSVGVTALVLGGIHSMIGLRTSSWMVGELVAVGNSMNGGNCVWVCVCRVDGGEWVTNYRIGALVIGSGVWYGVIT